MSEEDDVVEQQPVITGPLLFVEIGSDGRPIRFYNKLAWGDKIPSAALSISEEMHDAALTWPGEVKWDGEKFVRCAAPAPVVDEAALRKQRDHLLAASDWTQLPDAPFRTTMQERWKSYRQQLRDLPSSAEWPNSFTWPTKPSAAIGE